MYIYISAMSKAQSKVYDQISAASEQIDIHIAKIMLYPDAPYVDHWMHEIWSFLPGISRLKGTNRLPKPSLIRRALREENDSLNRFLLIAEYDEDKLEPHDITLQEYTRVVESYQDWVCQILSTSEAIRQVDVKAKLNELIFG